jgi:transcriptional regulator with XRE-family HTH domain
MPKKNRQANLSDEEKKRRKKVGAFIKARRKKLRLSQGDMCKVMGYANRNSISNVELGREGLPLKKIYQYADVLKVDRDDFFKFVVGELGDMAVEGVRQIEIKDREERKLSPRENDLVVNFRRLSKKYQDRIMTELCEYLELEGKDFMMSKQKKR